ncbi:MAG: hypothetical protein UF068_00795, partial [Slackia isoflavoniconvertens]|nr:hypothetical protein [Slackia isoflavoniconvertens]
MRSAYEKPLRDFTHCWSAALVDHSLNSHLGFERESICFMIRQMLPGGALSAFCSCERGDHLLDPRAQEQPEARCVLRPCS